MVTFLGGTSDDPQVDATKILLAQGGSLLSTWRYASDLSRIDAAKLLGDIAAARMQANILAAIIAAGGIVDADVAAGAAIAKSKISTSGTWALTDLPVQPMCKVTTVTQQSIPNSIITPISFDLETYDNDNIHDPATNPSRLTCKTAGVYFIYGNLGYMPVAGGRRLAYILKNGSQWARAESATAADANSFPTLSLSTFAQLAVNNYVELAGMHTQGAAINTLAAETVPSLGMFRIGP